MSTKHAILLLTVVAALMPGLSAQDVQIVGQVPVGSYPRGMAVTPDGMKGYVPDVVSGKVSVIDLQMQAVLKTLSVGSGARSPVVSPDGKHVYVLASPDKVAIIDVASDSFLGSIRVPTPPSNIIFSADSARAVFYVLSAGSANYITVVDTTSFSVMAQIPMPVTTFYNGFAISPDNRYLLATTANAQDAGDYVTVIDLAMLSIVRSIAVGTLPVSIEFGAEGTKAYVANYESMSVTVIDMASLSVMATLAMNCRPYRLRAGCGVSARYVWALGDQAEGIGVIDTQIDALVSIIGIAGISVPINDIAFRTDGRVGVATAASTGTINLVDANNGRKTFATVLKTIATGGKVTSVVRSPSQDMMYVIDERAGLVVFCAVPGGKEIALKDAIAKAMEMLKSYKVTASLNRQQRNELDRAIASLEGRRGGMADNGAVDKLDGGDLHGALVKVEHSMKNMAGAPGLDAKSIHKLLAEGSKTDTGKVLAGSSSSEALGYYSAGLQDFERGDYLQAVRNFRKALGD